MPEVSWPLSPGESGAAALELALEELGFVVEAELPAVDESVPVAEVVPVEVVEEDDGVDVEDTVAAAAFFCANPSLSLSASKTLYTFFRNVSPNNQFSGVTA